MNASIIILAGGKSSRMKRDKAFVTVGNQPLIERIIDKVKNDFQEIIVVTNRPGAYDYLQVKVVSDLIPGLGPLSGMHAGLICSTSNYNLVVACDMPFVSTQLASLMLEEAPGYDVVAVRTADGLQPLHGIYGKDCIPVIETALKGEARKITHIYPYLNVKVIEAEKLAAWGITGEVFFNVNTPEDLERANSIVGKLD
ncbi:MAG TPA: molybdenum cofactor guanylyltransferase [Clostridia bacterium]|nr:molybdenum cofactor guanylyltransferase [Clostridia bacterium]